MENFVPIKVDQEPKDFERLLKEKSESAKSGIYQLQWFENGLPRTLTRLCGNDKNGIIYIGMTENSLLKRVCNLQKALLTNSKLSDTEPSTSGHTQMGFKYFRIRRKVKIGDLFIRIITCEEPKREESKKLDNYVKNFGELPPLNGQYGSVSPDWGQF